MSDVANRGVGGGAPTSPSGVPRAVIPPFPSFELTSPAERPASREDFVIAEIERRLVGRAVRVREEIADPDWYRPPELQEPEWTGGFRGHVARLVPRQN